MHGSVALMDGNDHYSSVGMIRTPQQSTSHNRSNNDSFLKRHDHHSSSHHVPYIGSNISVYNDRHHRELQVNTSTPTSASSSSAASHSSTPQINNASTSTSAITAAHSPPTLSSLSPIASFDALHYESDTDSPALSSSSSSGGSRTGRSFSEDSRKVTNFDFATNHLPLHHRPSFTTYRYDDATNHNSNTMDTNSWSPSHSMHVLFLVGRRLELEVSRTLTVPVSFKSLNDFVRDKLLPHGSIFKLAGVDGNIPRILIIPACGISPYGLLVMAVRVLEIWCDLLIDKTRPVSITDDASLQRVLKSPPSTVYGPIIHCEVTAIHGRFQQVHPYHPWRGTWLRSAYYALPLFKFKATKLFHHMTYRAEVTNVTHQLIDDWLMYNRCHSGHRHYSQPQNSTLDAGSMKYFMSISCRHQVNKQPHHLHHHR
jgi:hypothetical protein